MPMGEEDRPGSDSTVLFYDEIHDSIDHQITIYTHLRNQAQRLIRILIAAGAIIIAIASSDIIRLLDISNLPRYHSQVASSLSVSIEFVELTSQVNILIGVVFLIIGVIFVLDSLFWATKVLLMRGLQPLMGEGSRNQVSVVTYSPNDDIAGLELSDDRLQDRDAKKWLENNDDLLYTAKERLRLTYERLFLGISFLIFGGMVLVMAQMGMARILALLNGAFIVAVIGGITWECWKGWNWLRGWRDNEEEGELKTAILESVGEKIADWPHGLLLPFLFITVSYGFLFSLLVSLIWLFEVVVPFLQGLF